MSTATSASLDDGAVPVGNESDQSGKFLMEHRSAFQASVAELVLDEDLNLQPRPIVERDLSSDATGHVDVNVAGGAADDAARAIRAPVWTQARTQEPPIIQWSSICPSGATWEALLSLHPSTVQVLKHSVAARAASTTVCF